MAGKRGAWGCAGVLGLLGVMLGAVPAEAQQGPNNITREQSKIWLEEIPGLSGPRLIFQYPGWNANYSTERYYAAAVPQSGAYPRLQVSFYVLAAGFVWIRDFPIDEKYLKNWPFLKDKDLKIPAPHKGGGSGLTTVRFEAGGAPCFAFLQRQVAIGTFEGMSGNVSLDGFYCAAPGTTLDDKAVASVLSGIRITTDPARPRIPIVRPAS